MNAAQAFLAECETELFDKPGRHMMRRVVERYPASGATPSDLSTEVTKVIVQHMSKPGLSGPWFEGFCVEVVEGDGMTWAAETVRRDLSARFPHLAVHLVASRRGTDRPPCITPLIGEHYLLKTAMALRLAPRYLTWRSWQSVLLVLVVVLLTSATQLATVILDRRANDLQSFFSPSFYVALLLYGVAAVVVQALLSKHLVSREQSMATFIRGIDEIPKTTEGDDLIARLANQLGSHTKPRIVIVDGFDSLDPLSQRLIDRYFQSYAGVPRASDCWIVFETAGNGGIAPRVPLSAGLAGFAHTRLYDLLPLDAEERMALAKQVGHPERAVFHTVKHICRLEGGDVKWIEAFFSEYVQRHVNLRESALAYFYLLALETPDLSAERRDTPIGGEAFFSWGWLHDEDDDGIDGIPIRSWTAEKTGERALLLQDFFGKMLRKGEVDAFASDIRRDFEKFLTQESRGSHAQVVREVALWLFDHAAEFKLPSAGVGKLYWALSFWERKRDDPFWLRRAAHHLLESDFGGVSEKSRPNLIEKIRAMYFGLIETHVSGCRFADVPDLVNAAATFIADFDPDSERQLARLLPLAWRIYLITGSSQVREVILSLHTDKTVPDVAASPLAHLFAETTRLTATNRKLFAAQLADSAVEFASAREYALVMAAWLACAGAPSLYRFSQRPGTHGLFELAPLDDTIPAVVEQVTNRIAANPAHLQVLDVATLSAAVWTLALQLHDPVIAGFSAEPDAEGAYWTAKTAHQRIERALTNAEQVVTAAAAYVNAGGKRKSIIDYLGLAMVNDACATSLAAVWLCRTNLASWKEERVPITPREHRLVRDVEKTLGMTILDGDRDPERTAEDDRATISQVENLLRACAMTWQRFGLARLSSLAEIRRVYFTFRARHVAAHDFGRKSLIESLSTILHDRDLSGILANLSIAQCVAESGELTSFYLGEAAQLARSDFGPDLRSTVVLIAALNSSGQRDKELPGLWFEELFVEDDNGASTLSRYVDALPDEDVMGPLLRLDAGVRRSESARCAALLQRLIHRRAAMTQSEAVKSEMLALLDVLVLDHDVSTGVLINPDEVMVRWAERRQSWAYPHVLQKLLTNGFGSERVREEGVMLLARDPAADEYNTWYHLALKLASELALRPGGDISKPLHYVEQTVGRWEHQDFAETNIMAYSLLARLRVGKRPQYQQRLVEWQKTMMERDHLLLLPSLARVGKYFLIFHDYVRHMRYWGLQLTISDADYERRQTLPPLTRVRAVTEWKSASGNTAPQALIERDSKLYVNAEFLLIGNLMFTRPIESDPSFEAERMVFNREAKDALPVLIDEIRRLRELPRAIRELIEQYGPAYQRPL